MSKVYILCVFVAFCFPFSHEAVSVVSVACVERECSRHEKRSLSGGRVGQRIQSTSILRSSVIGGARNGSLLADRGYQLDSAHPINVPVGSLHHLTSSVQCRGGDMTLRLKGKRVSRLLVEREGAPPVPVSQLPGHCGFSVRRTRRDLMLVAPYDGCHVGKQGDHYVLPLRVLGTPLKMSCPVTPSSPPTVTCGRAGMVVKVEGTEAENLKVKVKGLWKPLLAACKQCGYSVAAGSEYVVITVPYNTPCTASEDAGPTLRLRSAVGETTLTCPSGNISPVPTQSVVYPQYYQRPFFWPHHLMTPPTTAAPVTYPRFPPMFYPFNGQHHPFYWLGASPTVAAVTTPAPALPDLTTPHLPFYPMFPPYYQMPFYPRGYPKNLKKHVVTPNPTVAPNYPFYPEAFYPSWYAKGFVKGPESQSPVAAAPWPVYPRYQFHQVPFYPKRSAKVPVADQTTPSTTTQSAFPVLPSYDGVPSGRRKGKAFPRKFRAHRARDLGPSVKVP